VFGWTTEFWDLVLAATGEKQSTKFWYTGPTEAEEHAVLRWVDVHHPQMYVDWYPFEHPQLGSVELGGWDEMQSWTNPPLALLADEVKGHAEFAVHQALAAPELEILHTTAVALGGDTWRIEAGVANTGWLPTHVTDYARVHSLVLPIVAQLDGATVVGGPARIELGQLGGRLAARFSGRHDGTPDRTLATWVVQGRPGTTVQVAVEHQRAGRATAEIVLG
jgi:hypothetical protein